MIRKLLIFDGQCNNEKCVELTREQFLLIKYIPRGFKTRTTVITRTTFFGSSKIDLMMQEISKYHIHVKTKVVLWKILHIFHYYIVHRKSITFELYVFEN